MVISKININGTTYDLAMPVVEAEGDLLAKEGRDGQFVWCGGTCYVYDPSQAKSSDTGDWHAFAKPDWYMDPGSKNSVQNGVVYNYINNICSNFVTTSTADVTYLRKYGDIKVMSEDQFGELPDGSVQKGAIYFLTND